MKLAFRVGLLALGVSNSSLSILDSSSAVVARSDRDKGLLQKQQREAGIGRVDPLPLGALIGQDEGGAVAIPVAVADLLGLGQHHRALEAVEVIVRTAHMARMPGSPEVIDRIV